MVSTTLTNANIIVIVWVRSPCSNAVVCVRSPCSTIRSSCSKVARRSAAAALMLSSTRV